MNKIVATLSVLMMIMIGCILKETAQVDAVSGGKVRVVGNIIYRNGKLFAELRFFNLRTVETPREATTANGLAIYYYDADKEIWIWPEKGMTIKQDGREFTKIEDMNRAWAKFSQEHRANVKGLKWANILVGGKPMDKEDAVRSGSFAIRISDDGKYVYYKTQGMIFNSSHEYLIDYGVSK